MINIDIDNDLKGGGGQLKSPCIIRSNRRNHSVQSSHKQDQPTVLVTGEGTNKAKKSSSVLGMGSEKQNGNC